MKKASLAGEAIKILIHLESDMSCLHPLRAWRNNFSLLDTRKRGAPFFKDPGPHALRMGSVKPCPLPCGRCLGCRLDYSRQWAMRGVCELQMNERSCFVTMTYRDGCLPKVSKHGAATLRKSHYQKFFRALRRRGYKFTYMVAGEYGEKLGRPHFHVIFFGEDFKKDSYPAPFKQSPDFPLYSSKILDDLWKKGHVVVGDVSFQSIQYVAGYITKKVTGSKAAAHYQGRLPEFMQASLKSPIGRSWLEKYMSDVFPRDEFVFKGKVMSPPKYFRKVYAQKFPDKALDLSVKREIFMDDNRDKFSAEDLEAKEIILLSQFKKRLRKLETQLSA